MKNFPILDLQLEDYKLTMMDKNIGNNIQNVKRNSLTYDHVHPFNIKDQCLIRCCNRRFIQGRIIAHYPPVYYRFIADVSFELHVWL